MITEKRLKELEVVADLYRPYLINSADLRGLILEIHRLKANKTLMKRDAIPVKPMPCEKFSRSGF